LRKNAEAKLSPLVSRRFQNDLLNQFDASERAREFQYQLATLFDNSGHSLCSPCYAVFIAHLAGSHLPRPEDRSTSWNTRSVFTSCWRLFQSSPSSISLTKNTSKTSGRRPHKPNEPSVSVL